MKKPLVVISRNIPKDGLAELYKHCRVNMPAKSASFSRATFLNRAKNAEAVVTHVEDKVNTELFRACPNLKIAANYAVGYDNMDIKAAAKAKVYVTNTPGDLGASVSEHAMAMILMLRKHIGEGDAYMRANKYKGWDPNLLLGNDVRNTTLGIIGTGRIGSALVKIAKGGFNMDILYYDVVPNRDIEKQYGAKRVSLEKLLKSSDAISVHVPLLPSTRHLIGAKELGMMKPTAVLVNTSRGPVIDEKALVAALKAKKIAGAGLDVFENEPKMAAGLSKLSNTVLTPHIASATIEARRSMGEIMSQNVLDALIRGTKPRNALEV